MLERVTTCPVCEETYPPSWPHNCDGPAEKHQPSDLIGLLCLPSSENGEVELTEDAEWILGRPNFVCGSIAQRLRELNHNIKEKAEAEQAYVIFWFLQLLEKYGSNWRAEAKALLSSEA